MNKGVGDSSLSARDSAWSPHWAAAKAKLARRPGYGFRLSGPPVFSGEFTLRRRLASLLLIVSDRIESLFGVFFRTRTKSPYFSVAQSVAQFAEGFALRRDADSTT